MDKLDAPAIILIIGAFGTMVLSVIAAIAAAVMAYQAKAHTRDVLDKTDTVVSLARTIESQGNSKATADKTTIAALQDKITLLIDLSAKAEERAMELARVQASRSREHSADAGAVAKVIGEALHATPEPPP